MPTLNRRRAERPKASGRNNKPFYQSARWHRLSREFRKKNPLCKMCLDNGITELGECVDHVVPLTEWIARGKDPYDIANLQTLSKRCHSVKTSKENPGWRQR